MIVNERDLVNWDACEIAYRLYELMRKEVFLEEFGDGHEEGLTLNYRDESLQQAVNEHSVDKRIETQIDESDNVAKMPAASSSLHSTLHTGGHHAHEFNTHEDDEYSPSPLGRTAESGNVEDRNERQRPSSGEGANGKTRNGEGLNENSPRGFFHSRIPIDSFKMCDFLSAYEFWCSKNHMTPIPYQGKLVLGDTGGIDVDSDDEEVAPSRSTKRSQRKSKSASTGSQNALPDIADELPVYDESTYGSLMLGERTDWKCVLRRKRRSKGEYDELWEVDEEDEVTEMQERSQFSPAVELESQRSVFSLSHKRLASERDEDEGERKKKRRKAGESSKRKQEAEDADEFIPSEDEF